MSQKIILNNIKKSFKFIIFKFWIKNNINILSKLNSYFIYITPVKFSKDPYIKKKKQYTFNYKNFNYMFKVLTTHLFKIILTG